MSTYETARSVESQGCVIDRVHEGVHGNTKGHYMCMLEETRERERGDSCKELPCQNNGLHTSVVRCCAAEYTLCLLWPATTTTWI